MYKKIEISVSLLANLKETFQISILFHSHSPQHKIEDTDGNAGQNINKVNSKKIFSSSGVGGNYF